MELVPENFPRPAADTAQKWNAYDDMVKWEKETAYTGDNLYFDWVTSWLNPVPNVAAPQAPSDVAAAKQVPVQRARQRLTNRRLPQQTLPETAAVVLAIPENAAADQQRSDTPAAAQAALETAAAGQLLSEDAAAAELPIHTDSEPVHTLVERFYLSISNLSLFFQPNEQILSNFTGLVLFCIDAKFARKYSLERF